MRRFLILALTFVVALVVALLLFPERIWPLVAGPPDQGAVDFAAIERPDSPNTFLACTAALCAEPDRTVEPFADAPETVLAKLDALIAADGNGVRVDDASNPLTRRYVVRTPWLKFPDTVNVEARPVENGTGLAIYSRSQIGYDDLDANEKRVTRWLAGLRAS